MDFPARQFLDACNQQGVRVNNYTQSLLSTPRPEVLELCTRRLHRDLQEWDHKITDRPLDVEQLPDDGITRTLGALANIGLGQEDERPAAADILARATKENGDCHQVEEAWAKTIQSRKAGKLPLVQIFEDQGEPIIMRKGRGVHPTAVLLQPVAGRLNNRRIVYPEGTLVRVDAVGDAERIVKQGGGHKLRASEEGYIISPVHEVEGLSFLRFSPLAFPIGDRERFFRNGLEVAHLAEIPDAMNALRGLADHLSSLQNTGAGK